ncbi:MAG TPA: N-acyl homoserine lactonase family protein [Solirubrobacteraceae bacterium]
MRVEMLNVGWISSSAAVWRQGEDPQERIRFPVPAYLIETDSERILLDTGLNPAAVRDTAGHYGAQTAIMELEQDLDISAQVDLASLTKVVLTHLHFDHAGGLALVPPSVPIVLQRREWEGGKDEATIRRNFFFPRDYALEGRRIELVDGDHDLLGDGSIELLLTPGHTPGHQSVRLAGTLVLGADVAHFAATLDDLRFPSFAEDFDAQAASAMRLRALRDAGTTVIPGHDPEVLRPGPLVLG